MDDIELTITRLRDEMEASARAGGNTMQAALAAAQTALNLIKQDRLGPQVIARLLMNHPGAK